jgi:hypothetical protein
LDTLTMTLETQILEILNKEYLLEVLGLLRLDCFQTFPY